MKKEEDPDDNERMEERKKGKCECGKDMERTAMKRELDIRKN